MNNNSVFVYEKVCAQLFILNTAYQFLLFQGGKNYGDEYLAELDYIEVVERLKEDYENDIPRELLEDSDDNSRG